MRNYAKVKIINLQSRHHLLKNIQSEVSKRCYKVILTLNLFIILEISVSWEVE